MSKASRSSCCISINFYYYYNYNINLVLRSRHLDLSVVLAFSINTIIAADQIAILVKVVKGEFTTLHKFGFPLSALATMQEAGFSLRGMCLDVKKSLSGFSVSFFLAYPSYGESSQIYHQEEKEKRSKVCC